MSLTKEEKRKKRQRKIRSTLSGTTARPRLCVYRSNKYIYAQIIDDSKGSVVCSSSSIKMSENGVDAAKKVGEEIAKSALKNKVDTCVFDRAGYLFHGRVRALAESAREAGLKF